MQALSNLDTFYETCVETLPSEEVREQSACCECIPCWPQTHLQLGAALVAAREDPPSLVLVACEDKLKLAAQREGFVVL
jgi:hypothetical protein